VSDRERLGTAGSDRERWGAWIAVAALTLAGVTAGANQGVAHSGGTGTISPSVVESSSSHRAGNGPFVVDILILWRGSPGWPFRRTGSADMTEGGAPGRDGTVMFSTYKGGLHLTASFDPASRTAIVLGERVELKEANVILVDRVDDPDGPVIAGTLTIPPTQNPTDSVSTVVRNTEKLLEYLRCEAQIPGGLNHPAMRPVCADAVLKGAVKAPVTVSPIPTGPVTNRAAGVAPPRRDEPPPPGALSSGNGILSAAVAGGWLTHVDGNGAGVLDLLVLWRGSPGWPLGQSSGGGSSGGAPFSTRRGMTVRYGGRSFYAAFDTSPRSYQIENEIKPLGDANVVFVDDVDSAGGLRVVKTLRVDPSIPDRTRIDLVIARSPELIAYLRCDTKLPDAQQQMMMDMLCARYRGK
jgi:hypothetical protein